MEFFVRNVGHVSEHVPRAKPSSFEAQFFVSFLFTFQTEDGQKGPQILK